MSAKPTLYDTTDYLQREADRTRKPELKAHYQRCADHYEAKAKKAQPDRPATTGEGVHSR